MNCSTNKLVVKHLQLEPFSPICTSTKEYIEKCSDYISTSFKVPKLHLELRIATNNKSDFGWCHKIGPQTYKISISEFVVGTPSEEYIIEHEVIHAYVNEYFPEEETHGNNFNQLANGLFFHNEIKRPWVRRYEDIELEFDRDLEEIYIYFDNVKKAIIKRDSSILDPNGVNFKHKNTETIYNNIFDKMMRMISKAEGKLIKN